MPEEIDNLPDALFEIKRLKRKLADMSYMAHAQYELLGPKALEVVKMWRKQDVMRIHTSWGPKAYAMTGEERAALLLEWENAPRRLVAPGEIDGDLNNPPHSGREKSAL